LTLSGNGGALTSNYNPFTTGQTSVSVTPAPLTLTGSGVYNGTTTLAGSALTASGVAGQTFTVTGTGAGDLSSANVQTNLPLANVTNLALGTSGNGGISSNYQALSTTGSLVSVTKADLSASGTQTYNGTTGFAGSNLIVDGVAGQTFTATGSGTLGASGNVQTAQNLSSVTGLTLSGNSGALTSNYNPLTTDQTSVSVTPAPLTLTGSKVYDSTTTLAGSALTVTGVAGQTFAVTGTGAGDLSSANVQTNQSLANVTNLALGTSGNGGIASNYQAISTTGSLVSVTPAPLTLSGSKVYDSTTTLAGSALTATGVAGQTFAVTGTGAGDLSSANVQTNQSLANVTNLALGTSGNGGIASNYQAISTTGSLVSVTSANLSASGTQTYNGTTGFLGGNLIVDGVAGQTFTATGSGTLGSAGNVQTVQNLSSVSGLTLSGNGGALTSNYNPLTTGQTSVSVTPANLSVSGTRTYDGLTDANASIFGGGTVAGISGQTLTLTGSGTVASKNVGLQNLASLGSLTLGNGSNGGLASNYTLVGGTDTVNITPAPLTVTGLSGTSRVYNGSTVDALSGTATLLGLVPGESLTIGAPTTGTLGSANAGSEPISIAAVTIGNGSGAGAGLASNYSFTQPTLSSVTIAQAPLLYTAASETLPTGQAQIPISGIVTGFVAGDNLSNATTGNLVWVTNATSSSPAGHYFIDGSGLTALNYAFSQASGNATALTMQAGSPTLTLQTADATLLAALDTMLSNISNLGTAGGNALAGNNYIAFYFVNSSGAWTAPNVTLTAMGGGVKLPLGY